MLYASQSKTCRRKGGSSENKETNLELAKVKSDVSSIKSMMNEVMQIVAEKDTITKEITDEQTKQDLKN